MPLTDKGKKLLSRGNFKVAKFALGDDEIDYSLFSTVTRDDMDGDEGYEPALLNSYVFEAYKDTQSNIQYGLVSFEGAKLTTAEKREYTALTLGEMHSWVLYIPILTINKKLDYSPTMSGSFYYLSANDETTEKLNKINNFKFLTTTSLENIKLVVESCIHVPVEVEPEKYHWPTEANTRYYILDKHLLDMDYFLYADNRLIKNICGIQKSSVFRNYADNNAQINFVTDKETPQISYQSEFDNFATYITKGIRNENYYYPEMEGFITWSTDEAHKYTETRGPKGGIVAFNPLINEELRGSSTSVRDFRYSDFGEIDQVVFSELPTSKFDYIDTTIYIIGATTNSRTQIPLRIIRYVGT